MQTFAGGFCARHRLDTGVRGGLEEGRAVPALEGEVGDTETEDDGPAWISSLLLEGPGRV